MSPRARRGGLSPARRLIIILASAAATLAAAVVLFLAWAVWSYQGPGPAAKSGDVTVVMLRKGAGVSEIASTLERAGVVRSDAIFAAAAQITGAARTLKAGEYEFKSRASMASILDDIRDGRIVVHQITVPEGMTSEAVVEALAAKSELTGDAPAPPEGSILPETYQFERGEDRAAVLKRMMDAREELLGLLWSKRQPDLPIATPDEAVTLASIVEKETGVASERPRVAAVFVNRLRAGMRLESDPTIIYGLTGGKPLGRGLRASELAAPNPYNTYQIDGLPPTPIANPGRAALAAVLDPPRSDALFFVADGTGGHVFAATYEEHLKNVERWRAIERKREVEALKDRAEALKER
ncbi:endolytic transglycosylase MltG [Phenylobacterium sp.]|uniref:endolytic transglycosylase MltG n=1 Tax=Phenylobacterium sp. TaxID=1871053 RepID=UPI002FC80360